MGGGAGGASSGWIGNNTFAVGLNDRHLISNYLVDQEIMLLPAFTYVLTLVVFLKGSR